MAGIRSGAAGGALLLSAVLIAGLSADVRGPTIEVGRSRDAPPPAHTGGFGEPTCQACHIGNELNAPGGDLRVTGVPDGYRPGDSYLITVVLRSTDMSAAGFQAAMRFDGSVRGGDQAGTIRGVDPRTHITVGDPAPVEYIHHLRPGTHPTSPSIMTWSFEWVAPQEPLPVVLHIAANSANGDDSPLGDLVYTLTRRIAVSGP